jgi:hypothetical protein
MSEDGACAIDTTTLGLRSMECVQVSSKSTQVGPQSGQVCSISARVGPKSAPSQAKSAPRRGKSAPSHAKSATRQAKSAPSQSKSAPSQQVFGPHGAVFGHGCRTIQNSGGKVWICGGFTSRPAGGSLGLTQVDLELISTGHDRTCTYVRTYVRTYVCTYRAVYLGVQYSELRNCKPQMNAREFAICHKKSQSVTDK